MSLHDQTYKNVIVKGETLKTENSILSIFLIMYIVWYFIVRQSNWCTNYICITNEGNKIHIKNDINLIDTQSQLYFACLCFIKHEKLPTFVKRRKLKSILLAVFLGRCFKKE